MSGRTPEGAATADAGGSGVPEGALRLRAAVPGDVALILALIRELAADWNAPAIEFYRRLGARAMDEWTVFRLTGDSLNRLAG